MTRLLDRLRFWLKASLRRRLLVSLVSSQLTLISLAMLAFPVLSQFFSYRDVADMTVARLLRNHLSAQSLAKANLNDDRRLSLYRSHRPQLRIALWEQTSGMVVAGSDAQLLEAVRPLLPYLSTSQGSWPLRVGSLEASLTLLDTEDGNWALLIAGNQFGLDDLPSFFLDFFPEVLPIFGPVMLGVLLIVPLILRRAFRPVQASVEAAHQINLRSPEKRLSEDNLFDELQPLVLGINQALDRLHLGLQRQKLYAANAAHELRTPVALLLARVEGGEISPNLRRQLQSDLRRLTHLTGQLLALSRLDYEGDLRMEPVELTSLLRELVADCAPLAVRRGRAVELETTPSPVWIRGDRLALASVLSNLIDNALQAEPEGGTVLVKLEAPAALLVCDHGRGISVESRHLVFEPFWRERDDQTGCGLGLFIVRELVQIHGGRVWVEEWTGGGACFRVELPTA